MDPNTAWYHIVKIVQSSEYMEDVIPHLEALRQWLDTGGFEPRGFDRELYDSLLGVYA